MLADEYAQLVMHILSIRGRLQSRIDLLPNMEPDRI